MGSSISYEADVDSPTTPGQKCVLSSAIEGVTLEKLLDGMEKYVRAGKTGHARAKNVEVTDKDGGMLVHEHFEIPSILGGGTLDSYNLYKIDAANGLVESHFYPTQFHFDNGTAMTTNTVKVLNDPVRVEFWQQFHNGRSSGPMQKGMLEKVMSEFGVEAKVEMNSASVSEPGKFSAVAGPISGGSLEPDTYLDSFKTFLVDTMGATELPDGTVIEERSSMLGEIGVGQKSFAKHVFQKEESRLYCYEYGDDESLTDCQGITHAQVHKDPFKVEQYFVQEAKRRGGESQKKLVEGFVTSVLKHMEESG